MFVLLVELEAAPERADELAGVLRTLVTVAKDEPGILFYSVQKPQDRADIFILYECYADRAAWEAHLRFEPARRELARFEALLAAPPKLSFCDSMATTSFG